MTSKIRLKHPADRSQILCRPNIPRLRPFHPERPGKINAHRLRLSIPIRQGDDESVPGQGSRPEIPLLLCVAPSQRGGFCERVLVQGDDFLVGDDGEGGRVWGWGGEEGEADDEGGFGDGPEGEVEAFFDGSESVLAAYADAVGALLSLC